MLRARRPKLDDQQDVLLVWAGSSSRYPNGLPDPASLWWDKGDWVGLFLQERERPQRVYPLTTAPNEDGPRGLSVARATQTELVIWETPEGSSRPTHSLDFFFDARSKRLIRKLEYRPFAVTGVLREQGVPLFIADDHKRLLVLRTADEGRGFGILSDAASQRLLARVPVTISRAGSWGFGDVDRLHPGPLRFGPEGRFLLKPESDPSWGPTWMAVEEQLGKGPRFFTLPQSTCDQFAQARPPRVRNGYVREGTTIREEIGPRQLVAGRLWFGKKFYDGEGTTGVGGFGYFEPVERRFVLFSCPEIADWSVSAIFVEPDAVWLGLVLWGEKYVGVGGILRWDRHTHNVRHYPITSVINAIARFQDRIFVGTDHGIDLLRGDHVERYLIDMTLQGGYSVVAR